MQGDRIERLADLALLVLVIATVLGMVSAWSAAMDMQSLSYGFAAVAVSLAVGAMVLASNLSPSTSQSISTPPKERP